MGQNGIIVCVSIVIVGQAGVIVFQTGVIVCLSEVIIGAIMDQTGVTKESL